MARLTFGPASANAEIAEARAIRDLMYQQRLGLVPTKWEMEDERDAHGQVMIMRDRGQAIATVRLLPVKSHLAEMRDLHVIPERLLDAEDVMEVSRLAAVPRDSSKGKPYAGLLLPATARWCMDHSDAKRFIAYCRNSVLKLMLAMGATTVDQPFHLPERTDEIYHVIIGDIRRTAALFNPAEVEFEPRLAPAFAIHASAHASHKTQEANS